MDMFNNSYFQIRQGEEIQVAITVYVVSPSSPNKAIPGSGRALYWLGWLDPTGTMSRGRQNEHIYISANIEECWWSVALDTVIFMTSRIAEDQLCILVAMGNITLGQEQLIARLINIDGTCRANIVFCMMGMAHSRNI